MGNNFQTNSQNLLQPSVFDYKQWELLGTKGSKQMAKSQQKLFPQKQIYGESQELQLSRFDQDYKVYQMRREFSDCLVPIYKIALQKGQMNYHCCSPKFRAKILIQKIQYRLCDLGQLNQESSCYILRQIFKAISAIYYCQMEAIIGSQQQISEQMICFNSFGQCKFWIDQNLLINRHQQKVSDLNKQQQILQKLIKLIAQRTSFSNIQYNFSTFLEPQDYKNAEQAKSLLEDYMIKQRINFITCLNYLPNVKSRNYQNTSSSLKTRKERKHAKSSMKIVKDNNNKYSLRKLHSNPKHFQINLQKPEKQHQNQRQRHQSSANQNSLKSIKTPIKQPNICKSVMNSNNSRSSTFQGEKIICIQDTFKSEITFNQRFDSPGTKTSQQIQANGLNKKKFLKIMFSQRPQLKKKNILDFIKIKHQDQ